MRNIVITAEDGREAIYPIPFGMRILVEEGDKVVVGQGMTEGYKSPADILRIQGLDAVFDYIIREVQKVYRSQEIIINDKHIEVIARQMSRKVRVEDEGDTGLLLGSMVEVTDFREENEIIERRIAAGETTLRITAQGGWWEISGGNGGAPMLCLALRKRPSVKIW